jgi:hypothetical protein
LLFRTTSLYSFAAWTLWCCRPCAYCIYLVLLPCCFLCRSSTAWEGSASPICGNCHPFEPVERALELRRCRAWPLQSPRLPAPSSSAQSARNVLQKMSEPEPDSKPASMPKPAEDPWRVTFVEFKARDEKMVKEYQEEIDTLLVVVRRRAPFLLLLV